jgi:tRNA pseudouridine13 synthase
MENQIPEGPCLTHDLPGTGGSIRNQQEDFVVEEVPLYQPSGEGTHLYLLIEKRGMPTFEVLGRLARALNRNKRDFGVAGLKDADAITRQYISIEHVSPAEVKRLDLERIRILDTTFHTNKLKIGHLKGNRFEIRIRDTVEGALEKGSAIMERLSRVGLPNYFGPQRFGNHGNTHLLGQSLLKRDFIGFVDVLLGAGREDSDEAHRKMIECYQQGDYEGALTSLGRGTKYERKVLQSLSRNKGRFDRAVAGLEKRMLQFYCSAFQAHLFNRYLAQRLDRLDRLEPGDIAYIHRKGAAFLVEDPAPEAPRLETFEISPSGPIFASKMLRAHHEPGRLEMELLKEIGFELEEIKGLMGVRLRGARRPLRVPVTDWDIKEREDGLSVAFFLPSGSYATVVLREITKSDLSSIR